MKRFVKKILIIIVMVLFIDIVLGKIFLYFQINSKGGDIQRLEYIANRMTDSVLFMGSSRAIHHYDTRIVTDSLGVSAYNLGMDGNGIIFNYGEYCLFRNRYVPKMIIYDVFGSFDLIAGIHNNRYLEWLRLYYDRDGIDSVFFNVDATEKYKMLSQMRRYNTRFTSVLLNYFKSGNDYINGYKPLLGHLNYEIQDESGDNDRVYDNLKLKYLENFIVEAKSKGTKVVFCISPVFGGGDDSEYDPLKDIAEKFDVPLLNHLNDSLIIMNKEYFNDSKHLNYKGAEFYTKEIVKEIKMLSE